MPQPFKRRGREVRMSPAVVGEQQAFGVLIALVATHWNKIEQSLGVMYTWLLMGQEPSAFRFYHALIDLNLKEKAFMEAAQDKLSSELIDEIRKFFVQLRKLATRRAKIIHGTWCTTPTKPLSLLLVEPRAMNERINSLLRYIRTIQKDAAKAEAQKSFDLLPDDYEEYHVRDFQTLMKDLVTADQRAQELANKVLSRALELVQE
jgi:hypothetical protein